MEFFNKHFLSQEALAIDPSRLRSSALNQTTMPTRSIIFVLAICILQSSFADDDPQVTVITLYRPNSWPINYTATIQSVSVTDIGDQDDILLCKSPAYPGLDAAMSFLESADVFVTLIGIPVNANTQTLMQVFQTNTAPSGWPTPVYLHLPIRDLLGFSWPLNTPSPPYCTIVEDSK